MKVPTRTIAILTTLAAVVLGAGAWLSLGGLAQVRAWAGSVTGRPLPAHGASDTLPAEKGDHGAVAISAAQEKLIGVEAAPADFRNLTMSIRTVGLIQAEEPRIAKVHARISGWVQKVLVDYVGQSVKKGDPLFTIYSPDLVATEEEYLLALKGQQVLGSSPFPDVAAGAHSLVEASRRRLLLWDISEDQVRELEQTRQAKRELTLHSPTSGYVTERNAFPNQYVTPETDLYTIADYSRVWVFADIYEPDTGLVQIDQVAKLQLESYPGRTFAGRLDYIQPLLEMQTRTLKVRMDFPNPEQKLKPGMFGNVELSIPLGRRLAIPDSALLDTGTRQLVFVQKGAGAFEPRDVKTGVRTDGYVEILQGLAPHEVVATSATFLIDSESQLRAALSAVSLGTGATGIAGTPSGAPAAPPTEQLQIDFRTQPAPPHSGENVLLVAVGDAAGKPVENAKVRVVFFMPAMPSMGMSAMRAEVSLNPDSAGQYRGKIQVASPGTWQVSVEVERDGKLLGAKAVTVSVQ